MDCSITGRGGRYAVVVSGDVDVTSTDRLRLAIRCVAEEARAGSVTVDLAEVSFLDVAGANALVAAANEVDSLGGALVVENATAEVRDLFRTLEIDALLCGAAPRTS